MKLTKKQRMRAVDLMAEWRAAGASWTVSQAEAEALTEGKVNLAVAPEYRLVDLAAHAVVSGGRK